MKYKVDKNILKKLMSKSVFMKPFLKKISNYGGSSDMDFERISSFFIGELKYNQQAIIQYFLSTIHSPPHSLLICMYLFLYRYLSNCLLYEAKCYPMLLVIEFRINISQVLFRALSSRYFIVEMIKRK